MRTTLARTGVALAAAAALATGVVTSAAPAAAYGPGDQCRRLGVTPLAEGATGPRVRSLQTCLTYLGMVVINISGVFDDNTKHAVITAQKLAGLERDGAVGPRTRMWLRTAEPAVLPAVPGNKPRTAVVDIARQVMFFRFAQRTRVIDVSTGSESYYTNPDGTQSYARTPRGYFLINRHIAGERNGPLGTMYSPSYFNLTGHAVHGSNSVPTYPASHGCVRVTRAMEKLVQYSLKIGSHIYIH